MGKVSLLEVFEDCQKGLHSHGKLVKRMAKIYKTVSYVLFKLGSIHTLLLLGVVLSNGLCSTKWVHSYFLFGHFLHGLKSLMMDCVPIFRDCVD